MSLKTLFHDLIAKMKFRCRSNCCSRVIEIDIHEVEGGVLSNSVSEEALRKMLSRESMATHQQHCY